MHARGGIRSGAARLLDDLQKRIEDSLFPEGAKKVIFHYHSAPRWREVSVIPLPGKLQEMSREAVDKDGKRVRPALTLDNGMKATLATQKMKSFDAFALSDLMEFRQAVEFVAGFQPAKNDDVTWSMVDAVRLICDNAVRMNASMRDAGDLG